MREIGQGFAQPLKPVANQMDAMDRSLQRGSGSDALGTPQDAPACGVWNEVERRCGWYRAWRQFSGVIAIVEDPAPARPEMTCVYVPIEHAVAEGTVLVPPCRTGVRESGVTRCQFLHGCAGFAGWDCLPYCQIAMPRHEFAQSWVRKGCQVGTIARSMGEGWSFVLWFARFQEI